MNLNLWFLRLFLLLVVSCLLAFRPVDSPKQRNVNLSGIFVESPTNWCSIQGLEGKASAYINNHDKKFKPDSVGMSVWIYTQKREYAVLFSYNSGLGKPFWNVYFGDDGEVSKHESGIMSEGSRPTAVPGKRP